MITLPQQTNEPVKKILLVDDESVFLQLLKNIILSFGYQTETAGNGLEAVEKLNSDNFDLIITDMHMPEMDGMELLKYLKENRLDIDVIVATGYDERYSYSDIIQAGASDYLKKPIEKLELRAKLDRVFREQGIIRQLHDTNSRLARINSLRESLLPFGSRHEKLTRITAQIVEMFHADFCRIWVVDKGDLCESGCPHSDSTEKCPRRVCLHLTASSGRFAGIEGRHKRVPFGSYKIGRIASGDLQGFISNDIANDDRIHKRAWAEEFGLRSFAGFRLVSPDSETMGVLILYSTEEISRQDEILLNGIVTSAAQVVQAAKIEADLHEKRAHLAHAARLSSIGATASGICHELNQPLNTIALTTTYMKRLLSSQESQDPEILEGLADIQAQLERAAKIIDNMRSFSRKDGDATAPIQPAKSVELAVSFFREQFRLRNIDLLFEAADVPQIRFNAQKLEQIVVNFLTNARYAVEKKALTAGKEYRKKVAVNLSAAADGTAVILEVSDNGTGMTLEEKEHCLEPFFTTKKDGDGTGLGLAIVRDFIDEFDCRLTLESVSGEGCTFRVEIPVIETA